MRGGILDVYGFGMAAPARLEWWGDDITSIRGFDLTTQRSLEELRRSPSFRSAPRALGEGGRLGVRATRRGIARCSSCCPPTPIVIEEAAGADTDEVERAWSEAEHHLEVARRLGEDVPRARGHPGGSRTAWRAANRGLSRGSRCATSAPTCSSASFPRRRSIGDLNRLRVAPRRLSAHAHPLRQRGPARAPGRAARRGRPRRGPRDARDRRAGRRAS